MTRNDWKIFLKIFQFPSKLWAKPLRVLPKNSQVIELLFEVQNDKSKSSSTKLLRFLILHKLLWWVEREIVVGWEHVMWGTQSSYSILVVQPSQKVDDRERSALRTWMCQLLWQTSYISRGRRKLSKTCKKLTWQPGAWSPLGEPVWSNYAGAHHV